MPTAADVEEILATREGRAFRDAAIFSTWLRGFVRSESLAMQRLGATLLIQELKVRFDPAFRARLKLWMGFDR